ncbi:MAG: hypothetical protein M3R27_05610 [Bacteroidota bacterium]|nr:hypothetical protein [Bacteroidota bacterium]
MHEIDNDFKMSKVEISKEDVEFIYKCYLYELNFDLTDSNNEGRSFYDNYQLLLTLDSNSEQFKYIFLNNLFGPIEYLAAIKKVDIKIYELCKKRLTKNIRNVAFYGDMFELYIAWTLVERKIEFNKPEPPDFEIIFNGSKIFIECASAQFDFNSTPSREKIFKKIKRILREKMQKPYVNLSTALFFDITNLCYHSKMLNAPLTQAEIRNTLSDLTKNLTNSVPSLININNYGVIIFFHFNSSETSTGMINYVCDIFGIRQNINADANLIQFVKSSLLGNLEMNNIVVPKFHH